ncbi:glycine betaine/L-proline transporter ProP [Rouxiella badensis]|uniref:glycine betaine/L-proline transporter ProP n=1 Tax=Rouxiella badensis TaxID=1646377 RepID=UPI001D144343|nr:glycine betaine/L-proline transporter ProP [Rouxiella badensis]MCC3717671.1 glycine betaine/L-proline transporter ProP [Rouxiella badensis]MCC3727385.1 glycine betaine/L-proline transporter ProP [Rouxiella badensis]MCC3732668.1 glycine betaine/L-proline transporter ProP [Rouxiella badensis]MCC3739014.1 glycine betaine/L-proline transporter ProP [Rouxiella badensis]MCC3758514.1 glycine betaine/L-proline transporter ProP [Rouxiella badensis]
MKDSAESHTSHIKFWRKRNKPELTLDDITIVDRKMLNRAVGAAALGNAMEWFDFGVYSFLAVTIGHVFFPSGSASAQLIATFATFAAAFLVRPLGGMVFGPLGDKIGRQKVLAFTMIMMAAGTFSIGLIPGYSSIGIAAPILLLVARLVQGFSTGGEYGGAATFIAEYSTDKRRGFMGSWLEFGTFGGYLLGAGLVTGLTAYMSNDQLLAWGWRIPFFIAAPLGLFGLYIRLKLEETPAFQKHMEKQEEIEHNKPQQTLFEMLRKYWRPMLQCIGLVLLFNVSNYMLTSYMPSYLTSVLGLSELSGLMLIMVVMFIMMPLTLVLGFWNDRLGRKPVLLAGAIGLIVLSIPSLMLIGHGGMVGVFCGLMLLGILHTFFSGTMPAALPALFTTNTRYSALAIGFNISVSLFGGTTPLVTSWLVSETGNVMVPAYYLMGAALIGAITVFSLKETARKPLIGSAPAVETKEEAKKLLKKLHLRKKKREEEKANLGNNTPTS